MTNAIIKIKRTIANTVPTTLNVAEPAYSFVDNKLYIGAPGSNVYAIAGKTFVDTLNVAFDTANAAFAAANSAASPGGAGTIANAAFNTANAAFAQANTGGAAFVTISRPGGRLSLTDNIAVMNTQTLAQTTLYYMPYSSNTIPIPNAAGSYVMNSFTQLSQTTTDTTKSPKAVVGNANYDIFAWNDAGTIRISRGPMWSKTATITLTIANPCVITWTAHNLRGNTPIEFSTTGALPASIVSGTTYYVSNTSIATNTFRISTTPGGAAISTASQSQSGVHTGLASNIASRGTGAGTTELNFDYRYPVNRYAITNGPAANSGLYLGTIRTTQSSTIDFRTGGIAANGSPALIGVWNAYNQETINLFVGDSVHSWQYNSSTWRETHFSANTSLGWRITTVTGLPDQPVYYYLLWGTIIGGTMIKALNDSGSAGVLQTNGPKFPGYAQSYFNMPLGLNYVQALESGGNAEAGDYTFIGDYDNPSLYQYGLGATLKY